MFIVKTVARDAITRDRRKRALDAPLCCGTVDVGRDAVETLVAPDIGVPNIDVAEHADVVLEREGVGA